MIRKTLVTTALTAGLVVSGAGMASAHECYVANRSDKGNAAAAEHSDNWYQLSLTELFGFVGVPAENMNAAVAKASAQGIPTSFTLFEKFTIPRSIAEMEEMTEADVAKSTDGKGIDHFFLKYGEDLIAIAMEFGGGAPPA